MPLATATTASKKAGTPAPQSELVKGPAGPESDIEMASELSDLSDDEVEKPAPFPLKLRKKKDPSNIVCAGILLVLCF